MEEHVAGYEQLAHGFIEGRAEGVRLDHLGDFPLSLGEELLQATNLRRDLLVFGGAGGQAGIELILE